MGILAKKRMLCSLRLAGLLIIAYPGNSSAGTGLYRFQVLKYFHSPSFAQSSYPSRESWVEPRITESGNMELYRPPEPVIDLLEKPSAASARRYLEWNESRMQKIINASKVLGDMILNQQQQR